MALSPSDAGFEEEPQPAVPPVVEQLRELFAHREDVTVKAAEAVRPGHVCRVAAIEITNGPSIIVFDLPEKPDEWSIRTAYAFGQRALQAGDSAVIFSEGDSFVETNDEGRVRVVLEELGYEVKQRVAKDASGFRIFFREKSGPA